VAWRVSACARGWPVHNKEMKTLLLAIAAVALVSAADLKLGKPPTLKEAMPLATLMQAPDGYVGKTVQVKGKIAEVCQMMGCWMDITNDAGQKLRIKVEDGVIVFPKDASGRNAVCEGKLSKTELTREQAVEQAKHEAEETGRKFNPDSIKGAVTRYQIEGTGAVILDR
jgi:hypothetical protein